MGTRAFGNPLPRLGRGVGHRQRRSIAKSFVTCALVFGTLGALVLEVPDRSHDSDPSSLREGEVEGHARALGGAAVAYAEPVTGQGSRTVVNEDAPFAEGNPGQHPARGWNPLLLWLAWAGVAGVAIGAIAGAVGRVRARSVRAGVCVPPATVQWQVVPERLITTAAS